MDNQSAQQIAIIDLGTNTFHLLIVERNGRDLPWKEVHRQREYVKLGSGGIEHIENAAFERGVQTMQRFHKIINAHQVQKIKAFGTAGLRRASNSDAFISEVKNKTSIEVEVISGLREAQLIASGISLSMINNEQPYLIMDIGGGSVEFILCDEADQIQYAQSFQTGVAILHRKFHQTEPIDFEHVKHLEHFLITKLSPLFSALSNVGTLNLVGASGTFEVLGDVLPGRQLNSFTSKHQIKDFTSFFDRVVNLSLEERLAMAEIPDQRADLIVVALYLIKVVLDKHQFEDLVVSKFALKEGMLRELLNF